MVWPVRDAAGTDPFRRAWRPGGSIVVGARVSVPRCSCDTFNWMTQSFRARLRSGERLIAPLVTLNSPPAAELLSLVGFDWLFIDAEHSPLDPSQMQALMQAASPTPCIVRLAASEELQVK